MALLPARKTYPQLTAASDVQDSDLLATYRSPGPLKRLTAALLGSYVRAPLALSSGSSLIGFIQAGTGAVLRTLQAKSRDVLHVKDFGVVADGITSDTAALQLAVNAAASQGKDLDFGEGTILIGGEISGLTLSGNRLFGKATIKAANGTDFMYLLDISNTSCVTIEGLTFDANKDGRGSAVGRLACLKMNTTVLPRLLCVTFKNTLGIAGPVSSVAVSASGGVLGLYAEGLRFLDLGTDANTKPSDGLFIRGNYCTVVGSYGENVTDHIVVLEGSNYGQIIGTTGRNCTSFVAMSNDTNTDVVGNIIDGVSGTCDYFGSFGGIVGVYTFGTGWIRGCVVTNISARGASGAGGGGPAILFSGNVEGSLTNANVHPGDSTGVMDQAIRIDIAAGGAGLTIRDCTLEVETTENVVRILNASNNISFENNEFREGAYAIAADGTSSFVETGNRYFSQATDKISVGGSATYWGSTWQSWTPVFSSDIGDAAATFTATPTVNNARIKREGETVTLAINFDATLQNVSPSYLAFSVPSWAVASSNNQYNPANVLNDTTRETGEVRTISGSPLRVYRANILNFSANANVSGRFVFTYEVS